MGANKYLGYTDFNTWRVFHDTLNGIDFESKVTADELKEISLGTVLCDFEMKQGSHLVKSTRGCSSSSQTLKILQNLLTMI